jgi:small basic protein
MDALYDPRLILALVGLLLPVLVALLTKVNAPSEVKALVLALLSTVASAVAEALASGLDDFSWSRFFSGVVLAFVAGHVAYKSSLVKPAAAAVAAKTPDAGLG